MAGDLLEKLIQYGESDYYPLHMPGHKRRIRPFEQPFAIDITEIEGFDNLHHAQGILLEAQRRAASLYGAEETYYLVNGSTGGILAAVSAAAARGGRILMARNCHRSVYHAVFLNGLRACYLYPQTDPVRGIGGSIRPEVVREALRACPDIRTVLVTSPTYDGVVSDIRAIAEEAHRAGSILIVDEAHGAHFGMHPYFPERALACGADLVINSLHKTLPAMTQTALLHVQGLRVDRARLRKYLEIYQSSSPSYVLMASMDACVDLLERDGDRFFETFTERLERMRGRLRGMRVLYLVDGREAELEAFDFDRSRVLISLERCGLTGPELARILRERYHLEPEMESRAYVTAIMTVADTQEGFDRLTGALLEIDAELAVGAGGARRDVRAESDPGETEKSVQMESESGEAEKDTRAEGRPVGDLSWSRNEEAMSIRAAQESPGETVRLADSAGRVSAEYIYLYPPGIPLLVPGERITEELLRRLRRDQEIGLALQGLFDPTAETIRVVS